MFEAYALRADVEQSKRLTASAGGAVIVLVTLLALAMVLSKRQTEATFEKSVDVRFRAPPVVKPKPPAPTPPAPKVVRKPLPSVVPTPAPMAAPVAAAAPIEAPKEVPKVQAKEAPPSEAVAARTVAVGGTGNGTGTAIGGQNTEEESAAPVAVSATGGPINLPEDAEPPEPDDNNALPEYPEAARASGAEAVVILKIVIQKDGSVGKINVMRGEEPFLSAALAVIKTWRYSPATMEGKAISTYKVVKIPFRLRAD